MKKAGAIDWEKLAGELSGKVRPDTASKYFPQNPVRRALIAGFMETLAQKLESYEWNNMLDVGAGEGFVDHYIFLRFPDRKITGLEPDPEALEVARSIDPKINYISGDGKSLPFPDKHFDTAVCLEVLEHIKDYPAVINEIDRVTSGPFIVSVPAWPFYQGANFLIGKNLGRLGEHPDHVVSFTRAKLKRELETNSNTKARVTLAFPWLVALCEK